MMSRNSRASGNEQARASTIEDSSEGDEDDNIDGLGEGYFTLSCD